MKHWKMKTIVLASSIFFLCGCTAKTDLIITSDYKVIETTTILQKNEVLLEGNPSIKEALQVYQKSYEDLFENNRYQYTPIVGSFNSGGKVTKTYPNLQRYIESTNFQSLYETATILKTNQGISFQATGENYLHALFHEYDMTDNPDLLIQQVEVNIQFHNQVKKHNADRYDEKTNTYTWLFDEQTENKYIEFELENKKRYDVIVSYYLSHYAQWFIIGGILIVVILFTTLYVVRSVKKKNEI